MATPLEASQERAALLALEMRSEVVLKAEEVEAVWYLLQRHAFEAAGGELRINYDDFSQVAAKCREALGPHTDTYFQASAFLRLARDAGGCVPLPALFAYFAARSRQLHLRVQLGYLDRGRSGSLGPAQLQQFLEGICPAGALAGAGVARQDWAAAAGALIWLAHSRRGRLPIKDLVTSPVVDELLQTMQLLAGSAAASTLRPAAAAAPLGIQDWFAPANVLRLRRSFAELDTNGDGMLSQEEFQGFSDGTMTPFFVQRLFAQHSTAAPATASSSSSGGGGGAGSSNGRTGPRGMDFATFATFVAAWEDRGHPGATRYFFPVLDLQGRGYIDQLDIYTLFREVYELWVDLGQFSELRAVDVVAEVTDLLRPADPRRITAADLERSGAGGVVVGLLADVNLFWQYENREALAQQGQQE